MVLGVAAACFVVASFGFIVWGRRIEGKEVAAGYTTLPLTWQQRTDVFLLDRASKQILKPQRAEGAPNGITD